MSEITKAERLKKLQALKAKQKLQNRREIAKSESLARQKAKEEQNSNDEAQDEAKKSSKEELGTTPHAQRISNLNYSLEDIAKWEARVKQKKGSAQDQFHLAQLSYQKATSKMKIDQEAYQKQKQKNGATNGMDYNTKVPKGQAEEVAGQYVEESDRKKRKFEKRNKMTSDTSDSPGFISDKNRQFNKKLERHYDEYTKDLKDSFKRGSAI